MSSDPMSGPRATGGRAPDVFKQGGWVPMREYRETEAVDFAIVGTGAGGGTLAALLAEQGFSVIGFDAGPYFRPLEDFASDEAEQNKLYWTDRRVTGGANPIRMGGKNGMELQNRLVESRSPLPIMFITGHGDVPMAVDTMKKGAMDFIQKPFKEEQLVSLVERMLEQAKASFSEHQQSASRDALLSKLTMRESQVLERIVAGRLNKQIADDLGISIKTVEAHRANIMEKLNANTVADLLKIALGNSGPKA